MTAATVAYLVDTHVGAMSQIIACPACTVAGEWDKGLAEDCQPLTAADLHEIDAAENAPTDEESRAVYIGSIRPPQPCEICGQPITLERSEDR